MSLYILLAWSFFAWGEFTALRTAGPFVTEASCEVVRQSFRKGGWMTSPCFSDGRP